jgi:hypothetical protein
LFPKNAAGWNVLLISNNKVGAKFSIWEKKQYPLELKISLKHKLPFTSKKEFFGNRANFLFKKRTFPEIYRIKFVHVVK